MEDAKVIHCILGHHQSSFHWILMEERSPLAANPTAEAALASWCLERPFTAAKGPVPQRLRLRGPVPALARVWAGPLAPCSGSSSSCSPGITPGDPSHFLSVRGKRRPKRETNTGQPKSSPCGAPPLAQSAGRESPAGRGRGEGNGAADVTSAQAWQWLSLAVLGGSNSNSSSSKRKRRRRREEGRKARSASSPASARPGPSGASNQGRDSAGLRHSRDRAQPDGRLSLGPLSALDRGRVRVAAGAGADAGPEGKERGSRSPLSCEAGLGPRSRS
ncbi:uncharacterized protein [Petaurus breviceps papuanus]|uniref:uncharacterized protein n=1 Tax=Petaurus breviceps papuanus TaxID=3040969 RepID=UPI0036D87B82